MIDYKKWIWEKKNGKWKWGIEGKEVGPVATEQEKEKCKCILWIKKKETGNPISVSKTKNCKWISRM